MREIKFRAWDAHYKRFTTSGVWFNNTNMELFSDKTHILMQYTGQTDKNDAELFEGDIVEIKYPEHFDDEVEFWEGIAIIEWSQSDMGFVLNRQDYIEERDGYKETPFTGWASESWEKIGNIHENPELIGGAV